MPPKSLSLTELIDGGLRPATAGALNQASATSRHLGVLRELKLNQVRAYGLEAAVIQSLLLLLRHVFQDSDATLMLDTLAVVYIIARGADGGSVEKLVGGALTLDKYNAILECVNPLLRDNCGNYVSFAMALEAINCHTVLKHGNPFREDPFTGLLMQYWCLDHQGVSVVSLVATIVVVLVVRSKVLIKHLLEHSSLYLSSPSCLPALYDLAIRDSVLLGDAATVHSAATSLGVLVDSILVPFWRDPASHAISRLCDAVKLPAAIKALHDIPHMGPLNVIHSIEYFLVMDRAKQRLKWTMNARPSPCQTDLGTNAEHWLRLRMKSRAISATGPTSLAAELGHFHASVKRMLPTRVVYKNGGQSKEFRWKTLITCVVLQSAVCQLIQVLQTFMTGDFGKHARKSREQPCWFFSCPRRAARKRKLDD